MRFDFAFLSTLLLTSAAASVIDPAVAQARRDEASRIDEHSSESPDDGVSGDISELWKRRGGGGGGGRGGGGGGRGGGSSSGGRGSSGGSSGGSRGSGQGYNTKSDSNVGGYSKLGSGPVPSFGGGKFYGGGAKVPYASGNRSPGGSIKPAFFGGAALGFWPGYWVAGAYAYSYSNHHHYYNKTSKKDEDHPVICGCAEKEVCSCEEIEDNDYWEDILKDGDYSKLNKSVVDITKVNGTTTILLNGTLPKGTTLKSDDEDDWAEYVENAAAVLGVVGLWPAVAAVGAAVLIV